MRAPRDQIGDGQPPTDIEIAQAPSRLSLEERNEVEVIKNPDRITQDAQLGVQKAEAVALVWSKPALYATFAWIWLCFFILSLQLSISSNMIYYAYADFSSAPQISQAYILGTIIGGVLQLPIAKTLNLWGRAEGYLVCLSLLVIGLIVLTTCHGPASFAAGYTLYWVGYTTTSFILSVFVADTAGLRNRAFAYAFIGTPTICTAFVGPLISAAFYEHSSWQWSYGCFAIIIVALMAPLALVFYYYQRKAVRLGILVAIPADTDAAPSGPSCPPSTTNGRLLRLVHHTHNDLDVVGGLLIMAIFVLLLLPFSLQTYGFAGYRSATFISMLVVGAALIPVLVLWERRRPLPFVRWELLFENRTVLGACILAAVLFFNFYTWDTYYFYYVQVVYNLDTTRAGYMNQIYSVGSTVWALVFGVWIRQTRHFKRTCLYFGAPLLVIGAGLMVRFRGSDGSPIGLLVLSQILIAFGGGTLVIGDEMAAMAAADREGVPLVLALISLFSSLGGALGYAVAGAVYTNVFPGALLRALPDSAKADYVDLYLGGSVAQMLYAVPGTPERAAIDYAWTETQKYECIAAAAICALAFPAIAMWKNYSVDRKQIKGRVL